MGHRAQVLKQASILDRLRVVVRVLRMLRDCLPCCTLFYKQVSG